MGMFDELWKPVNQLIRLIEQYFDNNYLIYGLLGSFILLWILFFYLVYKVFFA